MTTRGHHGLLLAGSGPGVSAYFAANLRTGNGSASWSATGPDLTGGGLVWTKSRNSSGSHYMDYIPGASGRFLDWGAAAVVSSPSSFTSSGATFSSALGNVNTTQYVNWIFQKAANFFDVVTYTGTGANQNIAHSLGVVPALVIVKRLSGTNAPAVYVHAAGAGVRSAMNGTGALTSDATAWNNTSATTSVFSLGSSANTNASGESYVAFVFAHNPSGDIQGFSYTGNGSVSGPSVSLGWHPQFIMLKRNGTGSWSLFDQSRTPGFTGNDAMTLASNSNAEDASANQITLVSGGFQLTSTENASNASGSTYYGIAIRA